MIEDGRVPVFVLSASGGQNMNMTVSLSSSSSDSLQLIVRCQDDQRDGSVPRPIMTLTALMEVLGQL